MAKAIIRKKYYNAGAKETSDIYALMWIETELPPSPHIGMTINFHGDLCELEQICWDPEEKTFSCTAKPSFLDRIYADSPDFDTWIEWQKNDGWELQWMADNHEFDAKQETSIPDDDEKFRVEISRLSEPARLELRRRLDEADCLGRTIFQEMRALEIGRKKLESTASKARILSQGVIVGLVGLVLIDLIYPGWMETKNTFLVCVLIWGFVRFSYSELICPYISLEVEKRRAAYEDACYRWVVVTGRYGGNKEWAGTHDLDHLSGRASSEVNDEHWASVERSVMRIVKNRNALLRYDMW